MEHFIKEVVNITIVTAAVFVEKTSVVNPKTIFSNRSALVIRFNHIMPLGLLKHKFM